MARTTKEDRQQDTKKVLDTISRKDLYEFLVDEKITNLLNEAYTLALESGDEGIKVKMLTDLLDRYFGKAKENKNLTSSDGSFKSIFIGDLKE